MGFGIIKRVFVAGVLASSVVVTSCEVDGSIDDRLWRCNEQAKDDECGEKDGRPMTCWQGYCMSSCDPSDPPGDEDVECLAAGVLLEKCHPSRNDCPGELNCYRRDLLADEGLCVPFPVRTFHEDCPGERRNACAGEILRDHLGSDVSFYSDHFQCVQEGCSEGRGCTDGETCLNASYRVAGRYPDICVPNCDRYQRCMPNFACMQDEEAAPGADPICVPGLPGVRCTSDLDCVIGKCFDLGVGFSICTQTCSEDANCAHLNRAPMYFVCAGAGDQKYCVNPTPFGGAECDMAEPKCPEATPKCYNYSPSLPFQPVAECRRPCDPDGTCPARGGLPHVCLDNAEGENGCYPGTFGIPCKEPGECIRPLECLEVELDGRELVPSTHRCTLRCENEADCDDVPVTGGGAYCGGGFCRIPGLTGDPCDIDDHCRSHQCFFGDEGVGKCVEE
jgi:hypothetical protein